MSEPVGTVAALWRFPVKSVLGETVDEADVSERGIAGDRAYALIDGETGKVVSAKNPKLWPGLFGCRASFVEAPDDVGVPAVRITLGDGSSVRSDSPDVGARLSRFFGRDVVLARAAPADFTIDQYHPDVEDADPGGHRDTVVDQKLGSAFFDEAGLPSPVRVGAFFDLFPLSVLTTSTLDRLNDLRPGQQVRRATVPHERGRAHAKAGLRRKRVGRSRPSGSMTACSSRCPIRILAASCRT